MARENSSEWGSTILSQDKLIGLQESIRAELQAGVDNVPDISKNTDIDSQTIFNVLAKWVESGDVVKNLHAKSSFNIYTLATEKPEKKPAKPKTDRDGFETGGYQPPEARDRIVKSLVNIPYQSSRHLCANTGASIDDVIEVIEGDDEITFQMVGAIAVYFLRTNEPTGKLYNSGNNSFLVKPVEEKTKTHSRKKGETKVSPEDVEQCAFDGLGLEESSAKLGVSLHTIRNYIYKTDRPDLKEAWSLGKQRRKDAGLPSLQSMSMAKRQSANKASKSDLCSAVGELAESTGKLAGKLNGSAPGEVIKPSSIPVTESEDEGFNEKFPPFPPGELAEILELGDEQFEQKMHSAGSAGCGECGGTVSHFEFCSRFSEHFTTAKQDSDDLLEIPPQVETNLRFEKTINHVVTHGRNKNGIEKVKAKLLETKPIPVIEDDTVQFTFTSEIVERAHYRTVTLSNGKRIFMSEDINIFELKPREAELCARLVGLIDEFETSEK
jgi:hypothetical protein